MIELTALIAFHNMLSKFNAVLAVPPQGFCRLPPRRATDHAVGAEPALPAEDSP